MTIAWVPLPPNNSILETSPKINNRHSHPCLDHPHLPLKQWLSVCPRGCVGRAQGRITSLGTDMSQQGGDAFTIPQPQKLVGLDSLCFCSTLPFLVPRPLDLHWLTQPWILQPHTIYCIGYLALFRRLSSSTLSLFPQPTQSL